MTFPLRSSYQFEIGAVGAAVSYFYRGRRGRYADRLENLATRARRLQLGLWKTCPHTKYDPYSDLAAEGSARSRGFASDC